MAKESRFRGYIDDIKHGIFKGIGWSFGVTFGFALVSVIIATFLSQFVSIPVIGNFVASVVEATQASLSSR